MINNGGKSGGNPYHDENGHFTSKGNQGSAQPKSDPIVDFNRSLWDTYFGGQPQMPKKKTTGEKVLNQMGLTNEEVMETHKEQSDQKALDDLGEKMNKLEGNKPKEYDFKLDEDGMAQLTFDRETPVYEDGKGGEPYETTIGFNDIFEGLLADYVTDEEWHKYNDEPLTEEFVNEMMDKYYSKANSDYNKKHYEDWLTAQERDRAEDEYYKETQYEKYGGSNNFEEDIEYDDIDADYERSYGPVDSPEKYEAYQKWLENGHSFDNIGGEEERKQRLLYETYNDFRNKAFDDLKQLGDVEIEDAGAFNEGREGEYIIFDNNPTGKKVSTQDLINKIQEILKNYPNLDYRIVPASGWNYMNRKIPAYKLKLKPKYNN